MNFYEKGIFELSKILSTGEVKAQEVVQSCLDRIESLNPQLNAIIYVNSKSLEYAQRIDKRRAQGEPLGPLAGIPFIAKDMFCTQGIKTTAASKILSEFIPPYSATVIEKLYDQDMILLAKSNQDEFAMGSSNETSYFGEAKNPWDLERVPGGSSGGSAAAVSAQMAPLALGTDTGGSIRQPAHFCGVVGLKPTYGRISRYGIVAFASSLDQAGPMTKTVRDAALSLEVMCGYDSKDSTSAHTSKIKWFENIKTDFSNLKVGRIKQYKETPIDEDVQHTWTEVEKFLKNQGANFVEVDIPFVEVAVPIYYLIATSEASSNLSRYDGVRYGVRSDFRRDPPQNIEEFFSRTRGEGFGEEVQRRILLGTFSLSAGYYEAFYVKACQVRRLLQQQYLEAFKKCDVILSPVSATAAFKIGERLQDPLKMIFNDFFTTSANLGGFPAISVPVLKTSQGLPVGVGVMASPFEEQKLFNVAQGLEDHFQFYKEVPHGISNP